MIAGRVSDREKRRNRVIEGYRGLDNLEWKETREKRSIGKEEMRNGGMRDRWYGTNNSIWREGETEGT
ncbi:hypothetical protein RRG08_044193 [Elysia crispata]|uniref:Uncharacterized protein n=1 Tax=Elysia crispata TaxID=231223 RepID=A0AAE0XXM4_9GAST|nr:hypothetical protein RRG08_044193 [Elysia crispata]